METDSFPSWANGRGMTSADAIPCAQPVEETTPEGTFAGDGYVATVPVWIGTRSDRTIGVRSLHRPRPSWTNALPVRTQPGLRRQVAGTAVAPSPWGDGTWCPADPRLKSARAKPIPPGMSIAVHTPVRSPADTRLAAVLRDYDSGRVDQAPLPDEGIDWYLTLLWPVLATIAVWAALALAAASRGGAPAQTTVPATTTLATHTVVASPAVPPMSGAAD